MQLTIDRDSIRRVAMTLVVVGVLVAFATRLPLAVGFLGERLADVTVLLIIAVTLTYVLKPLVHTLTQMGGGTQPARVGATLMAFLLLGGLMWLGGRLVLKPLVSEWKRLEPLLARDRRKDVQAEIKRHSDRFARVYQEVIPDRLKRSVEASLSTAVENQLEGLSRFTERFADWLRFVVELIAVPVLVFYFLTDGPRIHAEVDLLVPRRYDHAFNRFLEKSDLVFDGYVRGQLILCGIAFVATTLAAWALGLPYAVTLGLWGGLMRAIPFFGPLFGGIPLVAIGLADGGTGVAVIAAVFTCILHFVESKFIMPKVIGHEVDLHPVIIIVSLLVAYQFMGLIGMFLAAPLVGVAKTILKDYRTNIDDLHATPAVEAVGG